MKTYKLLLTTLICSFYLSVNAQIPPSYKGVTIDRDFSDNTCIIVKNTNRYPVKVRFRYKIGSKSAEWIDVEEYQGSYLNDYIYVEGFTDKKLYVGSKVYALDLWYVDIIQPSVLEKVVNYLTTGDVDGQPSTQYSVSTPPSKYNSGSLYVDVRKNDGNYIQSGVEYSYTLQPSNTGCTIIVHIVNKTGLFVHGRVDAIGTSRPCGDNFRIHPYGTKDSYIGCAEIPSGVIIDHALEE